jgi:enolase-phosphatase E1
MYSKSFRGGKRPLSDTLGNSHCPLSKASRATPKNQKLECVPANATNGFNAATEDNNQADLVLTSTSIPLLPRDCKFLLLDIEGCTTAISFVHDVLFPFARSHADEYLKQLKDEKEVTDILHSLRKDVEALPSDHPTLNYLEALKDDNSTELEEVKRIVVGLMSHDVKATGLKSLQGKIWKSGYVSGELKGHVYEDFKPMLDWCKAMDVSVNIYSSGSIGAQKLLFGHSTEGDLCGYFQNHFDTTSGGKKESQSYKNIAQSAGVDVKDICFVSDSEDELIAAREAGIGHAVMSVRPGNAKMTSRSADFPKVFSLLQLCGCGK